MSKADCKEMECSDSELAMNRRKKAQETTKEMKTCWIDPEAAGSKQRQMIKDPQASIYFRIV